ncbi:hypothetical protein [Amycolatopsis albispora]|uniref:Uncharacterized protein n=1 Tax=Amycolatopsis albispora TaxID=1804986 RepID=A0A344LA34_9PSEU|nr:hypothetical protein [Amycolatopsis albispora]AXB44908.1 hypothetical protein A4R43_22420 [Amycolatopsis albispora]
MQTDQYGRTILPENGPPRRRGKAWLVVLAVVVLAAAGAGIYFARAAQDERPAGADADLAQAMWSLDKNQPFLGTPAQDWAEGEAAIRLPEPVATGDFSAKQVGVALAKVKEFLVAGRVNRTVLGGGDIEPLLAPLAPSARESLRSELSSPATWPDSYATKLAPGFQLLPAGPKADGTVRVEPGARKGELLIKTNLVFAYAFDIDDPGRATTPLDVVASTRWDLEFVYRDGGEWYKKDLGLDKPSGVGYSYSIACGPANQGLLAPSYSEPRYGTPDGKRPPEHFDPAAPIPTESSC